ncbi:DUF2243 domain-containing protein [Roseomonas frigidaquae]|uniref:DUF2243 domain-containing protein n=1 Tax=Falsiroseomonas frigidaquae TaxID=487318 RepID=A0ABX1F6L9_9PROT|nr:DUF2243 domain-containing protein [Falsiroseomonas frigidaquae]NKE48028.1 DUF2243 domain-containing protein [Falsiroseomonas frigidaquae]
MQTNPGRLTLPALLIGFALGGFLDGILLHQILQWHHLLSGVTAASDLRLQMFWDGIFHAAHYLLGFAGLWMLLSRRAHATDPGARRALVSASLIGFGAWHLLDAVLNHWILGLHRIREGSPNLLAWDLVFFGLGLVSVALGIWVSRRRSGGGGRTVAAGLAACVLAGAPASALPPRQVDPAVQQIVTGGLLPGFCAAWTRIAPPR